MLLSCNSVLQLLANYPHIDDCCRRPASASEQNGARDRVSCEAKRRAILVSYRLINRKYLSLVYEAESKPAGASGVLTLVSQTTKSMRIANAVRVIGVEIMKIALQITKSEASQNGQEYLSVLQNRQTRGVFFDIGMREVLYLLVAAALLTVLSVTARSQTLVAVPAAPPSTESNAISVQPSSPYARPTQNNG